MTRYSRDHIMKSERAYKILRRCLEDEGSYATGIADELDADRTNVSEIMSNLFEMGLLEKGKRAKAQYYKTDIEGFYKVFRETWEDKYKENFNEESYSGPYSKSDENSLSTERTEDLVTEYSRSYIRNNQVSTLEKMLVEDFYSELDRLLTDIETDDDFGDFLYWLKIELMRNLKYSENGSLELKSAILRINPEWAKENIESLEDLDISD